MQVMIASGPEMEERAVLGMAYALAAAVSEMEVVVFFTMKGAAWTDSNQGTVSKVNGFYSIGEYWDMLLEAGAIMEGCSSCVENYCNELKSGCTFRDKIVQSGLPVAAMRASTHTVVCF